MTDKILKIISEETIYCISDIEKVYKETKSYDDMSIEELNTILNHALENNDFETVEKIRNYL